MSSFDKLSRGCDRRELLCSPELADAFLGWFIWKTLDSFDVMHFRDVGKAVSENYQINEKVCQEYVRSTFELVGKTKYRLSAKQKIILDQVEDFAAIRQSMKAAPIEVISDIVSRGERDELRLCAALSCLHQSSENKRDVDYQILFFLHLLNESDEIERITSLCDVIPEERRHQELRFAIHKDYLLRAFPFPKVRTLGDLLSFGPDTISDFSFIDVDYMTSLLQSLSEDPENLLQTLYDRVIDDSNPKRATLASVLKIRCGIGNRLNQATLEETGQRLGLTRERIRQIEIRVEMELANYSDQTLSYGFMILSSHYPDVSMIAFEDALECFNNPCLCDFVAASASTKDKFLCFDMKLGVFYDPKWTSPEQIIDRVVSSMDEYVSKPYFDSLKEYQRRAVLSEYSLRDTGYYVKRGVATSRMIMSIMERFFQNGYGGYDEEHYKDLCAILRREYGPEYPLPTMQAMRGLIGREDYFCQIDRGLHIPRSLTTEPDIVLQMSIIDFLHAQGGAVYYRTIYEKFKDEFLSIGVNNHFYAKGLIDPYLRDYGFHTKRDYVIQEGSSETAWDTVNRFLRELKGEFTFQDIRNRFPGVEDYVFQFQLYEMPEILNLSGKHYIHYHECGVTETGRELIRSEIEASLEASEGFATCHRIWTNLYLFHPGFEAEMGVLRGSFALFSYVLADPEFREKYELRRPYILRKGAAKPSEATFAEHFVAKRSFTIKDCADYRDKHGLGITTYSFIGFVESISDGFVLISRYEARRSDAFPITEKELNTIRNTLLKIVRTRGEFSSADDAGLSMMPEVVGGVDMSPSLLLGITWTYLQGSFIAELDKGIGTGMRYVIKEAK